MAKLIVGLGNPGREYEQTRHNIGFMLLDHLDFASSIIWKDKYKGIYAKINAFDDEIHLLKPQTFMNLSGESVQKAAAFFKIEPKDIFVVHDELDIPYGTIAMKNGGGLAGHNGLKSIAQCLGTKDFLRLRMGIGRPTVGSVSNFVLSDFSSVEKMSLDFVLKESSKAVGAYLEKGFDACVRNYNKKKLIV